MYVKIVRPKKEDSSPPYIEWVYECEGYNLMHSNNESGVNTLTLNPHLDAQRKLIIDIDPSNEEVYIMNNDGKTIDYYIWAKEE